MFLSSLTLLCSIACDGVLSHRCHLYAKSTGVTQVSHRQKAQMTHRYHTGVT